MHGYETTNHPTSPHRPFTTIPDAQTRREKHLYVHDRRAGKRKEKRHGERRRKGKGKGGDRNK